MASPTNSAALVLFNPRTSTALVKISEEQDPDKRWALTFSGFTGRTLANVYTVCGHALEKQANRVAHKIGLGSQAATQKLMVYFGDGEQRLSKLEGLRTCIPPKVRDYCANIAKYALPCAFPNSSVLFLNTYFHRTEAPTNRLRAFKNVVHLCTRFPGLRKIFLGSNSMRGATSVASIYELWDPPPGRTPPDEEGSFWQGVAAACLSETTTSGLIEATPVAELAHCQEEALSVIERLLVEWDCS